MFTFYSLGLILYTEPFCYLAATCKLGDQESYLYTSNTHS